MKFEMNRRTLDHLLVGDFLRGCNSLTERKYTLFDIPVVVNTNKPNGIVQLGRETVDLTYTDNISATLESLVHVAKMREGGRINFGPSGSYSIPVTKEEDEVFNSMTRDSGVSLHHCQTVKDWKKRNIGGSYTPSEEDIDELIEIVLKEVNHAK